FQPVENGSSLSLGKRSLTFLETRMLHWPDSMFSYCPEEKLLFSSDAFGQHYAGLELFDDQIGEKVWPHALKYYANILNPFSALVLKVLDKVRELGLELETICPDHGVIWRRDPGRIIEAYARWARQAPTRKAVIVYDTMWHSTETMAEALAEALGREGVYVRLMHLRSCHRSDVITELHEAGAILVGSPTLNNQMFPTVADFLCYMKGLKPQNKVAAAFGSHGWSGEAVKLIYQELAACKFDLIEPGVKAIFVPGGEVFEACHDLGRRVAEALPR
ncbi:MAG: flavodoxin domain-containing protein, partial [Thermodesulfobacteriota bacterium]